MERKCLYCKADLAGRTDKKYCDAHCKSAYQYKKTKEGPSRFYNVVDNHLRLNRKILKEYNKSGKSTVNAQVIKDLGFNPNFFTHYWKNQKADVYLFVYEYGFLSRTENGKEKYILVTWQPYMQ